MKEWITKYVQAITTDTYVYVGMLMGYFTLEGSAKRVAGILIFGGFVFWMLTLPIREPRDKSE
jgi:hypothetical protein